MNRCLDCGHIFSEPALGPRECEGHSEAWGVRQREYSRPEQCPECESKNFKEFRACSGCNEEEAIKGDDFCLKCIAIEEAEALDYIENQSIDERRLRVEQSSLGYRRAS